MDHQQELLSFGERLVRFVRDEAIATCDRLADGQMRGVRGERWASTLSDDACRRAATQIIPDVVDEALFRLGLAIDNGDLPLGWRASDGSFVGLEELAGQEVAGWLAPGAGGWIEEFARERSSSDY